MQIGKIIIYSKKLSNFQRRKVFGIISNFLFFKRKEGEYYMKDIEELFDREMVEGISNLVEEKMKLLKEIEDFREKDKMLTICLEEMDSLLSKELKEKFDNVMKLTYQVEEYYFTLAYLLGSKYREKLKGI